MMESIKLLQPHMAVVVAGMAATPATVVVVDTAEATQAMVVATTLLLQLHLLTTAMPSHCTKLRKTTMRPSRPRPTQMPAVVSLRNCKRYVDGEILRPVNHTDSVPSTGSRRPRGGARGVLRGLKLCTKLLIPKVRSLTGIL